MKKKPARKQPRQKRNRLARIALATNMRDKLILARTGMNYWEYFDQLTAMAKDFFETRRIDPKELEERVKRELHDGKVTPRTEAEWGMFKSLIKRISAFAWRAAHNWHPEDFESFARAMRRYQRHKFPAPADARRRSALIRSNGKIAEALQEIKNLNPDCVPLNERRTLNRLKKVLFRRDT